METAKLEKDMNSVQYVLDRKGRRKSVSLPLREYEDLLEDLHDLAVIAERRDETPRSLAEVRQNLTRDHVL